MTDKFTIYRDNEAICQNQQILDDKVFTQPTRREPLGLKQIALPNQSLKNSIELISRHSPEHVQKIDEDQENDISMASLGSDFVPTIHNEQSFEYDEERSTFISTSDNYYTDADLLIEDENMLDEDDDALKQVEYDDELRKELSRAFQRHDDSLLFKSATYVNEIQSYMKQLERIPELRALPNYIDFQEDINSDKRAILVNWLVEVADEFELQTETLFICINIIDRFLSEMSIETSKLQLLGVAAMFTASKYEEIYPPNLYQFVDITDDCYSSQQIRQMEILVLKSLNFRISMPTANFFLRQIFAYNKFSKKVYDLAEYLCYLTLSIDQPFLEYLPSEIALASVILSASNLDAVDKINSELKQAYNQSIVDQMQRRQLPKAVKPFELDRRKYTINESLPFCIESLRTIQERVYENRSHLPQDPMIVNRFKTDSYNYVAQLAPIKVEDLPAYFEDV